MHIYMHYHSFIVISIPNPLQTIRPPLLSRKYINFNGVTQLTVNDSIFTFSRDEIII